MFRSILLVALVLFIIFAGLRSGGEELKKEHLATSSPDLVITDRLAPKRFGIIPSSDPDLENYRSAQPSADQLTHAIDKYDIEVVVRLNGDEGGMSVFQEKKLAESMNVQFVRLNAHLTDDGPGYDGSAKVLARFLQEGKVLVHCQHGYDRVGALIGHWLASHGYSPTEIIDHNQWNGYLEKKGEQYRTYWITAL